MMGSVRIAFRAVWATEIDQPFLRSKALDFVLVLGTGLLIVAAWMGVLTVVRPGRAA